MGQLAHVHGGRALDRARGRWFRLDKAASVGGSLRPMRTPHALAVATGVLLFAGCSNGSAVDVARSGDTTSAKPTTALSAAPNPPATDPRRSPATTSPSTSDAEIEEAFREAVDAEWEASKVSDPYLDALARTHAGPIRQRIRDRLIGRRLLGQVAVRPEGSRSSTTVESVEVDGDTAVVVDCTVDDAVVRDKTSGRVVNDKVVTQRRRNTLRNDAGHWKITDRTNETEQEGVTGCATT